MGSGGAIAAGFAVRGAQVIITGRDAATLEATAGEIGTGDLPVVPLVCDVAEPDDISRLVNEVADRFGHLDTVLNVAGVNRRKRVETYTPEDYDFIVDINQKGAFLLALEAGRRMIDAGRGGSIINIESLNTYSPLRGVIPYAMSKGGMQMMTRGLALEWGRHGIRVNSLAPGFILTELTQKLWSDPTMQDWGQTNTALGRMGEPDDMVGTAIFLASKASAFLTGQVLYVDGGFSAGSNWPIPLD